MASPGSFQIGVLNAELCPPLNINKNSHESLSAPGEFHHHLHLNEAPMLPGPMGAATSSPTGGGAHQTINNNINIINYITTIACSHPSHNQH